MKTPLLLAVILFTLSACALLDKPAPPVQQWLQLNPPDNVKILSEPGQRSLAVTKIQAPDWLQDGGLYYRLAYRDTLNLQPYAQSRWITPVPQQLLQSLRGYLMDGRRFVVAAASQHSDYVLELWLDEFCQIYRRPDDSYATLRAHATLLDANHRILAQNTWRLEIAAASADALGGAQALQQVGNQWIQQLDQWIAKNLQ